MPIIIDCQETVASVAAEINQPDLHNLICRFLYDQQHCASGDSSSDIPLSNCPKLSGNTKIHIHNSATAYFYALSDLSGIGGMRREYI
jgi:hypothetical protein